MINGRCIDLRFSCLHRYQSELEHTFTKSRSKEEPYLDGTEVSNCIELVSRLAREHLSLPSVAP